MDNILGHKSVNWQPFVINKETTRVWDHFPVMVIFVGPDEQVQKTLGRMESGKQEGKREILAYDDRKLQRCEGMQGQGRGHCAGTYFRTTLRSLRRIISTTMAARSHYTEGKPIRPDEDTKAWWACCRVGRKGKEYHFAASTLPKVRTAGRGLKN